jgi:hypothetical protein
LSATINAAAAFWWAAIVATIGSRDVLIRYATRLNALWEEPNMQIVTAQVHAYERYWSRPIRAPAAPPSNPMNSRRLMAFPRLLDHLVSSR